MAATKRKRYPLPKRLSIALSEKAYARLRGLNEEHGFGNNYLLTFLLENLDEVTKAHELDRVFKEAIAEYGRPGDSIPESR